MSGEWMPAGRVGRAHGLDGSFYVTGARAALLVLGARVRVGEAQAAIVRRAGVDKRPIVRIEGIDDRAAAESLRGLELSVASADAPTLGEDEWWAHELEGCLVVDGERPIGRVLRLIELPSCEALEVRREPGSESLLVPMVRDAIRRVDVDAGKVDVNMSFIEEG
jgi:16S rRNA processing protein RimM